jgi:hypothetical protein
MPEDPKAQQELIKVEKALGRALAAIREDKQMTVDDIVRNTGTYFDDWTVERIEHGEEERMFLTIPCMVRLIVEGFHADLHEVGQLMGEFLKS